MSNNISYERLFLLEDIVVELQKRKNGEVLYPDERGFKTKAAQLIRQEITNWYQSVGVPHKIPLKTALAWTGTYCPDWVIAVLKHRLRY